MKPPLKFTTEQNCVKEYVVLSMTIIFQIPHANTINRLFSFPMWKDGLNDIPILCSVTCIDIIPSIGHKKLNTLSYLHLYRDKKYIHKHTDALQTLQPKNE